MSKGFNRAAFLVVVQAQALLHLVWSPGSLATKFTNLFAAIFGKGRFSWCGAFQTWCLIESGCFPAGTVRAFKSKAPPGYEHYTFALVEYWQQWAMANGIYHHNDGSYSPVAGDLEIFDWNGIKQDSGWDDHIGCDAGPDSSGLRRSAEGNTGNQTALKLRSKSVINGWIHIPEGFEV